MMKLLKRLQSDAPLISDGAMTALLISCNRMPAFEAFGEPQAAEHPYFRALKEKMRPQVEIKNGVAYVPVSGVLARKPDAFEMFQGVEDTAYLHELFVGAVKNPDVSGIVLVIDSPGGFMTGGPEFADAVRAASKSKPVIAWTGGIMASLAYYIGSQASAIVASRSAQVGGIGVYTAHVDFSRFYDQAGVKVEVIKNKEAEYKALGFHGTALTEAGRAHIQDRIQASFRDFKAAVSSARPQVSDDAMRGQVMTGAEAKAAGLIDRIGDLEYATALLRFYVRNR